MRVLTVVPLPPGPRGGIEDYVANVFRALRGRATLDVVAPSEPVRRPATSVDEYAASLHRVRARPLFRRLIPVGRTARREVESLVGTADVVHVHMPSPRLEAWAAMACVRGRVPLVATYHMDALYDGGRFDARSGMAGRLVESLYDARSARPTLSRAQIIVTNSRGYAQESRLLPSFLGKIRAIHQGVSPDHTVSKDGGVHIRQELTNGKTRLVTFLGRLVPYKGLHVMVEAAKSFSGKTVTFAVGGKGPLRSPLESEVDRLGLREMFRFLGFIPDGSVGDLLRASDVVVCPSISLAESTPIVLLEALACGTPVVGTRLGGSEETLPDDGVSGRLVAPRDPRALSEAIQQLLDANMWAPNRRSLCLRTWDDVATEYLRLYEEVLSS
ncbi:MAG: glycosyltransferase [Methanobacteriota archaeon]|nr:MAG: glycosyltransferase [Euryarchaeota archaeon]